MGKRFRGRTVTAILRFPDNKILLVERGTTVFKGYWALPGGRVEPGETIEQAIIREVKEETGLNIKINDKLGEYRETGVQDGVYYDYQAACFLATPVGGQTKKQVAEIREIRLVDLKALPKKLAFEHRRMIRDYEKSVSQ